MIAIDTSILIAAEKTGDFQSFIEGLTDDVYIPAHAAAEFLVGTHPPVKAHLRERARRMYEDLFRDLVDSFDETDAAQLAALNAENRRAGQTMKLYDTAIAATAIARADSILALDGDFDRLKDRIKIIKPA